MILGDSLHVMASLAEREGLRHQVQCIYFDPPYGIKFNSNFQWSTTSRDVKDGKADHITREPEQVKAFRDTWRDGIHSYLTTIRDRLTVARDLLTESGSIFVQIGQENQHRVRDLLDEVFGSNNCVSLITMKKTGGQTTTLLPPVSDYLLWYAKDIERVKYRQPVRRMSVGEGHSTGERYDQALLKDGSAAALSKVRDESLIDRCFRPVTFSSHRPAKEHEKIPYKFQGKTYLPPAGRTWTTNPTGFKRLVAAQRIYAGDRSLNYLKYLDDFPANLIGNLWDDVLGASDKVYVVQTTARVIERCLLMTTDPGDLVLDPTCGSGTTAFVAEQSGRRWITIDTSRVAMALARARIMGARYPFYLLSDSREGQLKEAEVSGAASSSQPVRGNIRHGFVYERVPHITLKSIANNAEIDVLWDKWQAKLEPLREALNDELSAICNRKLTPAGSTAHQPERVSVRLSTSVGKTEPGANARRLIGPFEEWEIPREVDDQWPDSAKKLHADWWQARIARQKEIDASIAAKAEFEYLYDKPYDDKKKVRVAGPFTVESLSPHRMLGVDENDDLIDPLNPASSRRAGGRAPAPGRFRRRDTSGG